MLEASSKYYTLKEKIVNIIGIVLPLILFVFLLGSLVQNVKGYKKADTLIEKTREKLEKARLEEKDFQDKLAMTQSDAYLEAQLRNKLGLAKEGEIVLVLPPAEELKKLSPQIEAETEAKPKPNYQKWLDLFN
jgi:cell division protein FtsB